MLGSFVCLEYRELEMFALRLNRFFFLADVATTKGGDDVREELDFQFDEDMDLPVGKQNK